jgi:hypothetical protein
MFESCRGRFELRRFQYLTVPMFLWVHFKCSLVPRYSLPENKPPSDDAGLLGDFCYYCALCVEIGSGLTVMLGLAWLIESILSLVFGKQFLNDFGASLILVAVFCVVGALWNQYVAGWFFRILPDWMTRPPKI